MVRRKDQATWTKATSIRKGGWAGSVTKKSGLCIAPLRLMTVITLDGNFERTRGSVCAIHDALKYPDNALLFLSDLRGIADGDHAC